MVSRNLALVQQKSVARPNRIFTSYNKIATRIPRLDIALCGNVRCRGRGHDIVGSHDISTRVRSIYYHAAITISWAFVRYHRGGPRHRTYPRYHSLSRDIGTGARYRRPPAISCASYDIANRPTKSRILTMTRPPRQYRTHRGVVMDTPHPPRNAYEVS